MRQRFLGYGLMPLLIVWGLVLVSCQPSVATMAISAIAFSNDLDQARVLHLASDLRAAADDVSRALGSRTSAVVADRPAIKRLAAPARKKRAASR